MSWHMWLASKSGAVPAAHATSDDGMVSACKATARWGPTRLSLTAAESASRTVMCTRASTITCASRPSAAQSTEDDGCEPMRTVIARYDLPTETREHCGRRPTQQEQRQSSKSSALQLGSAAGHQECVQTPIQAGQRWLLCVDTSRRKGPLCHPQARSWCDQIVRLECLLRWSATPTMPWSPTRSVCTRRPGPRIVALAAEKYSCAIRKRRHTVKISFAWSIPLAVQQHPRCRGSRHGQCEHVVQVAGTGAGAAEKDRCAIRKHGHAVRTSCAWSVPCAVKQRPQCIGPRHGQCVHVVQVAEGEAAEKDRCAICKRGHSVTRLCA